MAIVKLNKKYGFIDKNGKEVIPIIYDSVTSFKDNLSIVKINDLYGVIDKTGKIVIEIEYRSISDLNEDFMKVEKQGNEGLINKKGQIVVDCIYRSIDIENNNIKFSTDYWKKECIDIPQNEVSYDILIEQGNNVIVKKFDTPEQQNSYYNQLKVQIDEENKNYRLKIAELNEKRKVEEKEIFNNLKSKIKNM